MDANHTPGPWEWDGYSLRPADPDPDKHSVHTILEADHIGWGFIDSDHAKTSAESDANLLLIAAAPDLIDAAKAAEAAMGDFEWLENQTTRETVALAKLRAAIAKATGAANG